MFVKADWMAKNLILWTCDNVTENTRIWRLQGTAQYFCPYSEGSPIISGHIHINKVLEEAIENYNWKAIFSHKTIQSDLQPEELALAGFYKICIFPNWLHSDAASSFENNLWLILKS